MAAGLHNPRLKPPLVGAKVRGAATHRVLGRWLWRSRPGCEVGALAFAPLGVSLNYQFVLPITKGRITRSAALLSIGRLPSSTYRSSFSSYLPGS